MGSVLLWHLLVVIVIAVYYHHLWCDSDLNFYINSQFIFLSRWHSNQCLTSENILHLSELALYFEFQGP